MVVDIRLLLHSLLKDTLCQFPILVRVSMPLPHVDRLQLVHKPFLVHQHRLAHHAAPPKRDRKHLDRDVHKPSRLQQMGHLVDHVGVASHGFKDPHTVLARQLAELATSAEKQVGLHDLDPPAALHDPEELEDRALPLGRHEDDGLAALVDEIELLVREGEAVQGYVWVESAVAGFDVGADVVVGGYGICRGRGRGGGGRSDGFHCC